MVTLALCQITHAETKFESLVGPIKVGEVTAGPTQVRFLTWGGDVATFVANGGLKTTPNSIFAKRKLNLSLVNGDDFVAATKAYLTGESPYLRGTVHMCAQAAELLNKDPRTKPVMILQETWSLGDHIVARDTIKTLNDLKGKTICFQEGGPHAGLLDDSLRAAKLSFSDVKIVYVKDLTGANGPAAKFAADPTIDACCVISPDMLGLTGGLDQTGGEAEGNVKGAHVVNSTAHMGRSIADVYLVRSDFFKTHKDQVESFVVGYLEGTERLMEWKKIYNDGKGKSPEYMAALKMAQSIYGEATFPTLEVDVHGLVSDANFVRIPGNEIFFNDPNNLSGFEAKQTSALDLALTLGYVKDKQGFVKPGWDYKVISDAVGVKYVEPTYTTGRIKTEVTDFMTDLDSSTIFSFEIKFEPEQDKFPVESYASDFQRFCESASTFSNAAIVVEGHSDPLMALMNFYWAAKAKGLLTGEENNLRFKGAEFDLRDTEAVIKAIQLENLSGQTRLKDGQRIKIEDPKQVVMSASALSHNRANSVKKAIEEYANSKGYKIDISQAIPRGVGIADPVNPRPRNMNQAKENMRVVFRVIKVRSEAINADDFNFDK